MSGRDVGGKDEGDAVGGTFEESPPDTPQTFLGIGYRDLASTAWEKVFWGDCAH